jgi:hypothetical protein
MSMVIDPAQQRREALAKAREVQALCAGLKQDLKQMGSMEGRILVAHVIAEDFERFGSLRVEGLLKAIRGWGPDKIRLACGKAEVSQVAQIRELTPGGRERLSAVLSGPQSMGRYPGA